jgi:hypothetical protein
VKEFPAHLQHDFTRECLALVPDTSLSGLRVVRELDVLIAVGRQHLSDRMG